MPRYVLVDNYWLDNVAPNYNHIDHQNYKNYYETCNCAPHKLCHNDENNDENDSSLVSSHNTDFCHCHVCRPDIEIQYSWNNDTDDSN
jgi:hypothetical protein